MLVVHFFVSLNGVVQCGKDHTSRVLHARNDRNMYLSDPWYTASDGTLSFHRVHSVLIVQLTCRGTLVGARFPDSSALSHCLFHENCMDARFCLCVEYEWKTRTSQPHEDG